MQCHSLCIALDKMGFCFSPKILLFFSFLHKNICCGYSLEVPHRGASNEYPQHEFLPDTRSNLAYTLYVFGINILKIG